MPPDDILPARSRSKYYSVT